MSQPQLLAELDAAAEALAPAIQAAQEAYFQANGRYAQLLWVCKETPADGAEVALDNLDACPVHQDETGRDLAPLAGLPTTARCNFACHRYQLGEEFGYVLALRAWVGNALWQRCVNVGPDETQAQEWAVIDEREASQ